MSESYQRVYEALSIELVKDYVPDSWIALVQVKSQYYEATAHQMVGSGLVASIDGRPLSLKTKETLTFMYTEDERASGGDANASSTSNLNFSASKASKDKVSTIIDIRVPKNGAEQLQLGNKKTTTTTTDFFVLSFWLRFRGNCPTHKHRETLNKQTVVLMKRETECNDSFKLENFVPPNVVN